MADLVSTQGWPLTAASTHQVALQGWATGTSPVWPAPPVGPTLVVPIDGAPKPVWVDGFEAIPHDGAPHLTEVKID